MIFGLTSPLDQFQSSLYFYLVSTDMGGGYLSFLLFPAPLTSTTLYLLLAFSVIFGVIFPLLSPIPFFKFNFPIFFFLNFIRFSLTSFIAQGNGRDLSSFGHSVSVFLLILVLNLLGLIPMGYAVTGQFHFNATLSLALFFYVLVRYFSGLGLSFFYCFIPSGVPDALKPLLFLIEFSSFLLRPLSLSLRLFANMVAGHVLLHIFAGFSIAFFTLGYFPFLFSEISLFFIYTLELLVCFLQAYVFFILYSIYLGEANSHS